MKHLAASKLRHVHLSNVHYTYTIYKLAHMSYRRLTESPCVRVAYISVVSIVLNPVGKWTCLHLGNVGKGILN
jgi:hypothetical protein